MNQRVCGSLVIMASVMGGMAAVAPETVAQQTAVDEVERERAALPHSIVNSSILETLGPETAGSVRLTPSQATELAAQRSAFERDVREFLKKNAGSTEDAKVPDRDAAIKKALAGLRKDQVQALEPVLKKVAGKRVAERHSSTTTSPDGKSQTSTSSEASSDSQSSGNSQSRHSSESKSDKSSDRRSSSDSKKQTSDDKHRGGDSSGSKNSSGISWSKLDSKQRQTVMRELLNELPQKEREELAKELKIETSKAR